MRRVQVFVQSIGETAMITRLGGLIPRRRIGSKKSFAFCEPSLQNLLRKRIRQPESDKHRHFALLPMRQLVDGLFKISA